MAQLNQQQTQGIQKCLGINVEDLVKAQPTNAHNIREAWDAAMEPLQQFTTKYGNGGSSKQQG